MIQRDGRPKDDDNRTSKTEPGDGRADPPTRSDRIPMAASKPAAPRVLVIDDTEVSRLAMVEVLAMAGCQVMQLASAIGATRVILQHKVQAAIIDVAMPGLSGDKLITLLRDNPRLRDLVIVVVSARSQEELEAIRAASGADAALDKAVVASELAPLLQRLLARSAAKAAP
jgi:CheY-like chemotaxis protein